MTHPIESGLQIEGIQRGKELKELLEGETGKNEAKQTMLSLADYLKKFGRKQRGTNPGELNSHFEEFIIREGEEIKVVSLQDLREQLRGAGVSTEIIGVASIGNLVVDPKTGKAKGNQRVTAQVQGFNPDKSDTSGYERPTVEEGPHMVLAIYAYDKKGHLHVFRTLQHRTGATVVDTVRGFSDPVDGSDQQQNFSAHQEQVVENIGRQIKDEGGEQFLKINRITFLGAPRVNTSFVTSTSAMFGVEVDYDNFLKCQKVSSQEELSRRAEQFEHEGITGRVLDLDVENYLAYISDPNISRDLTADAPNDLIVMAFLFERLQAARTVSEIRAKHNKTLGEIIRTIKNMLPENLKAKVLEIIKETVRVRRSKA